MRQIFYREVSIEEGFALSDLSKNSRVLAGKEVSNCSGIALFNTLRGAAIKCWRCKCVADRWIATRNPRDTSRPVLNLYATRYSKPTKRTPAPIGKLVMMTRDHIIPKSLGGVDLVENLRPGCEICNGGRGSTMNRADKKFMLGHPHLISEERVRRGLEAAARRDLAELLLAQGKP